MRKTVCVSFFSITLFVASLAAKIIETPTFQEVLNHLDADTLLVVDIDDTLIIAVQTLGTDVWFQYRLEHHLKEGLSSQHALEAALAEWEAVRHLTGMRIVEAGTDKLIQDLQQKKVPIMALTTQGLALATRTVLQLNSVGIDLTQSAPADEDVYFTNGHHGVLYRKGILFTSGTDKGRAFQLFLNRIDYQPKKVVFINDKLSHLTDLEKGVAREGIEFVGLRYSHEDRRVADFNIEIAEIQWNYSSFAKILSDEEAREFLMNRI